jgi:TRAP-type uncharacterized transport system substrate-binding protein
MPAMTRLFLAAAIALLVSLPASRAPAQSTKVRIASGPLGSTYREAFGPNLGQLLHGYKVVQMATSGSVENLELLSKGNADLAFAQADVYASLLAKDPARYGQISILGKVSDECVFVARRKTSDISNLTQLAERKGKPATVAIGSPGGGASGTWSHLSTLVPGLERVSTRPEGGTLALNQLAVGAYDAVIWVTDPTNIEHPNFRAVELSAALTLMSLTDPGLLSSLPDGTEVYRARYLKLDDGRPPREVNTVCTSALVYARSDASPKLIKKTADAIALRSNDIIPKRMRQLRAKKK